jgi:hypothetical protein
MSAKINQVNIEDFSVSDLVGDPVEGIVNGDFVKTLYNPSDTEVSGSITVTVSELGNGDYRAKFTPDAIGKWYLVIRHATHFPGGKGSQIEVYDTDLDTVAASVWDSVLSGQTHNVPGSAGRRLRNMQDLGTYEGGAVWIDTVDGVAGTDLYENGVVNNPVSNLADARTIADNVGLKAFNILSGSAIVLDQEYDGFSFGGIGYTVDLNSKSVTGTHFSRAMVTGDDDGIANSPLPTRYEMCGIDAMAVGASIFNRCALMSDLTLTEAAIYLFDHCLSAVAGTGSPTLDFGDSGPKQVNMRHYSGGIEVLNMGHVTVHKMSLEGNGQLKINANCTDAIAADQIAIRGNFKLTDYVSGGWGGTISDDARFAVSNVSDGVWDEPLTGLTHNIATSAGRRLRELGGYVVYAGTAVGAGNGVNQIELNGDASDVDGAYDPSLISIVDGLGAGQSRLILEYEGSTRIATVDRNWKVQPNDTSDFVITGNPGREHVNEGLARGGTINTITLNALGSDDDDVYNGQRVFIRSGKGEDQAGVIKSYNGTSKVATMWHDWTVIPDDTTGYAMIPDHIVSPSEIWDDPAAKRVLGMLHENISIDQPEYDNHGNMESARVRIYSDNVSVGSDDNVIGEYLITAPSSGPGKFITWEQVKV